MSQSQFELVRQAFLAGLMQARAELETCDNIPHAKNRIAKVERECARITNDQLFDRLAKLMENPNE